jgi:uncharacterized protein YbjT (DUF2867 family)
MRVLLIGGTGFIGRYVAAELSRLVRSFREA